MGTGSEADDATFDYIIPACASISKVMGSQFSPYLPYVMPALLAGATVDTQFSMVDAEEDANAGEVVYYIYFFNVFISSYSVPF